MHASPMHPSLPPSLKDTRSPQGDHVVWCVVVCCLLMHAQTITSCSSTPSASTSSNRTTGWGTGREQPGAVAVATRAGGRGEEPHAHLDHGLIGVSHVHRLRALRIAGEVM